MKKRYKTITFALVLLILFSIYKNANYDMNEFKLGLKSLLRQELTLDEIKSSNLYKAYKQLDYNSNIDETNNIMKKENDSTLAGSFKNWDMGYGNILIRFRDNESHIFTKLISFDTPYTVELNDEELNLLFKCEYLEEITEILGEPLILAESYNENGEINERTYEWGIKAKYLEPQQYYLLPYKRKLRARVNVGENNLIWTVNIDKY